MMLPKIGDIVRLLKRKDVGEARFKVGTKCIIANVNNLICSICCYDIEDKDKEYSIYCEHHEYELIPETKTTSFKVGNIIKYIGPDRHAFDGIKTELVVHGQILIINEIDEYGITANTVNTNHAARKMNLRIGPEHMENVNNLPTSCKMDAEAMKIQNQISEAMEYKPRDKTDLIEHWQLKTEKEKIDHPEWYNKGIETIDFIDSWSLNFELGNVIKYVTRSPYKGTQRDDLLKALWYLCREMKRVGYGQELTDFCKKEANGTEKVK